MKFYFLKSVYEKVSGSSLKLKPLPGQTFESGAPVDPAINVAGKPSIRMTYPVGTVFGCSDLASYGTYYRTEKCYPVNISVSDLKEESHRAPEDMQRAYEAFVGITPSDIFDDSEEEEPVRKNTYLNKMKKNASLRVPDIITDGFYVNEDVWYLLLRNIRSQVNTLMIGPTGTGKCLGKDTPVLMYDGTIKRVQDIIVGDKLMGPDSKPRNVLSVTTGREELFRVTPKKGDSWVCNKSHILSLKRTNDGTSLAGTICNVGVAEYLGWSKTHKHIYKQWRSAVDFPEKELSLDPYFLGIWLGDGRTDSPIICTPDRPIVHYLKDYSCKLGCTLSTYYEPSKANSYAIVQKELSSSRKRTIIQKLMDKYNLFGNKHIPSDFLYNSRKNRLLLFAGLMDTDRSYQKGYFEYCTKLDNLKNEVVYLGRSLGYFATVRQKEVSGKLYWRIIFSGNFSDVPTKLKRKRAGYRSQKKDVLVTSISVESIGEGDYYGFSIDGDHLFMLGDFTVTHNTELIILACKKLGIDCSIYDMGAMYDPVAGLLGVHRLQEGGVSLFDYAKFTKDISKPGVVLLDELSRAPVTTNNILFPCLDSRRSLPVEIAGGKDLREIKVHEDCCFIATANIGAEYTGTMEIDRALQNRFFPLELSYLPPDEEVAILKKRCHIGKVSAGQIVSVANTVRELHTKQEISCSISTRETLMAAELVADGWSVLTALELSFLPLFEGTKSDGERSIVLKIITSR